LLTGKLPEALKPEQKDRMIHNLLTDLRIRRIIKNDGSRRLSRWVMV
jgi:hypothetical protein